MKYEFSAGGIVYKTESDRIHILIGQHSGHNGWVFPKGLIGDHKEGETKEETAVREVKEETGITGSIQNALTPISFWYQWKGEKHKKTVYYYVMKYSSGDTKDHDWEMKNVEWIPIEEVENRLTYSADKKVWVEAKKFIAAGY